MVNEGSLLIIERGRTILDPSRGIDNRPNQRRSNNSNSNNSNSNSNTTNPLTPKLGTYDPKTFTYTDPNGNKSTRPISNIPVGTYIELGNNQSGSSRVSSTNTNTIINNLPNNQSGSSRVSSTNTNTIINNLPNNQLQQTRTDLNPKVDYGKINLGGYISQGELLNYVEDETTGQQIPIYSKAVYTEPLYTEGGNNYGERKSREATQTEQDKLINSQKVVSIELGTASNKKVSLPSKIINEVEKNYNLLNQDLKNSITYPIRDFSNQAISKTGLTSDQLLDISNSLTPTSVLMLNKDAYDLYKGIQRGIVNDVIDNPLKQALLLGTGEALGFGYKAVSTGLSAIPKIGSKATTLFKTGALGYGVYETANTLIPVSILALESQNKQQAGELLGVTLKDLGLIGIGFKGGEKTFEIGKGIYRTRGRTEINIKQGEYPTADTNKQLDLFQKNIYNEISDKPISFHTTSDVFYKNGKIIPNSGTSELAGLYTSTQISTPFSRITGSGAKTPDSFEAFVKSFMDSLRAETNSGVASLEPKGFREVSTERTNIKQFEGQKEVNGKYFKYTEEAKAGYLDIPKIKNEIESIARKEAGSYKETQTSTGEKYYVKIAGVKIPLDTFKFDVESISKDILKANEKLAKDISKDIKEFNPSEYSLKSLKQGSEVVSSSSIYPKSSKVSSSSSISSEMSKLSSSISSEISKISSSISSNVSGSSGGSTGSGSSNSSSSSNKSSSSSSTSGKSSGSSNSISTSYEDSIKEIYKQFNQNPKQIKPKNSLGAGYLVYIKQVKTKNTFVRINDYPLTKRRAKDVQAYYLDNSLARTSKLQKGGEAKEDYQFNYIPENYYENRKYTLREFKIKNGTPYNFGEQEIKKSKYLQDTQAERNQLQAFRKQVKNILR